MTRRRWRRPRDEDMVLTTLWPTTHVELQLYGQPHPTRIYFCTCQVRGMFHGIHDPSCRRCRGEGEYRSLKGFPLDTDDCPTPPWVNAYPPNHFNCRSSG